MDECSNEQYITVRNEKSSTALISMSARRISSPLRGQAFLVAEINKK